jgi:hypothetical protein
LFFLCILQFRVETQCIMRNMHYDIMHYDIFDCIGLVMCLW